jgi:multidrug efflux pump subunit AcrA (membrane-fusion protein)
MNGMSDDPQINESPELARLREIQENPDRRMTRAEWEREESIARQIAHSTIKQPPVKKKGKGGTQDQLSEKQSRGKILLWVIGGLVVMLLIFFLGFLPRHMEEKRAAKLARERETATPEVQVAQVRRTKAPGELTVPGTTAPLVEAYVYARANGYLSKRYVDIGDHVRKGQLLALIDAPDLDQQVEQAREQLNQAEAQVSQQQAQLALNRVTWERWRTLVAKGVFSRQDGDQREADYKAQVAIVNSAERNVESYRANLRRVEALQSYERVTAPFDGVITQRNSDVGALVGASGAASSAPMQSQQMPTSGSTNAGSANTSGTSGTPSQAGSPSTGEAQGGALFAIAQIDRLRILVSVPEGYASSIHQGMKAQVFMQEKTGKPIDGVVTRTASSIDQNSRTMLVEIDIDNRNRALFPGAYTVVSFVQVRGLPPLVVPGDAVVVRNDRTSVAVVRDNKVQMTPVEIGRDYGPSVEILSGIREGDWVVTTVTDAVQPGIKVRSTPDKEAQQQSAGAGGANTQSTPDFGPDQYGDQSIVDSKSESTTQKGKQGQNGKPQAQKQADKKGSTK